MKFKRTVQTSERACYLCEYKHMPNDGGYCYMFRAAPYPKCAIWTAWDGYERVIAREFQTTVTEPPA